MTTPLCAEFGMTLPLFTFAGISFIFNPMKMGMTALYMPKFDAGGWLAAVERLPG